MSSRFRLTDELIRSALTPAAPGVPDDIAIGSLAEAIRSATEVTAQRRYWWTPLRALTGPFGPPRWARLAMVALVVVALLTGLLLALAGTRPPLELGDGAMFHGGPTRTGRMMGPGPVTQPTQIWAVQLGGPMANTMPALKDGALFVAEGQGNVAIYDPETGEQGWSTSLARPATSPAAAGGVLVVGAGEGLYGIDAATGVVPWTVPSRAAVTSAAAIVTGIAYAGLPDGSVVAVDVETGRVHWQKTVGGPISRAVAVAEGLVFAGDDSGTFRALNASDGTIRWSRPLGSGALSTPAAAGGEVVVATGLDAGDAAHVLYSLDARSGDPLLRSRLQQAPPCTSVR